MIICHSSDQHGFLRRINGEIVSVFPEIKEDFDVFVCSGDMLPNLFWGANKEITLLAQEKKYQEQWVNRHAQHIKQWCHNKPFLFSSGNHDFINPCKILKKYGINAIDLDDNVVEFMGYTWLGFPYIPFMGDNWNHERNAQDMFTECNRMLRRLKDAGKEDKLDLLVAHCPPKLILDLAGNDHIGNAQLLNYLTYRMKKLPKLYLSGHCHEQGGKIEWFDADNVEGEMCISNAATTYNILDLDNMPART